MLWYNIIDKLLPILNEENFDYGMDFAYFALVILLVLENAYGKKAMTFGYISPYTLLILIIEI